jgi:hypothetical protein
LAAQCVFLLFLPQTEQLMNQLKLTSFAIFLLIGAVTLYSCKKDEGQTFYTAKTTSFSSSQVITACTTPGPGCVPPTLPPSIGKGTLKASYDKNTKILSYIITIDTVQGNPVTAHIHGIADSGFLALPDPLGPFKSVSPYAGGVVQVISTSSIQAAKKGTLTGTLFADGMFIKEEHILGGKYYFDIHTNGNALYTGFSELRAQLVF